MEKLQELLTWLREQNAARAGRDTSEPADAGAPPEGDTTDSPGGSDTRAYAAVPTTDES
jgi:hypothetical protein